MLLQPAGVTKPTYPGNYDASWATLHREAKNSSDWAARREWTQTALTGWAAFMVGNDDAAVTSTDRVHGWGVASFTSYFPVFLPIIITSRKHTPANQVHKHACAMTYFSCGSAHIANSQAQKPFPPIKMWAAVSSSLGRTVIGTASWGDYHLPACLIPFQSFHSCSAIHDI